MRTQYTYLADGEPVLLAESWEPFSLTTGTAITFPEEGPRAGRGVVERMAVIGQHITRAEETVSARPAPSSLPRPSAFASGPGHRAHHCPDLPHQRAAGGNRRHRSTTRSP